MQVYYHILSYLYSYPLIIALVGVTCLMIGLRTVTEKRHRKLKRKAVSKKQPAKTQQRQQSLRKSTRKISKKFPKYHPDLEVGSLCLGNTATSEVEKYFRKFIIQGVKRHDPAIFFYPPGIGVVTVDIYSSGTGRVRLRTPDFIAEKNGKKLLIELDPWFTHQDVQVDKNRNTVFNSLGFFVYRIRLGKNSVAVSNTDIVILLDNIGSHNPLPRKYRDQIISDIVHFLK